MPIKIYRKIIGLDEKELAKRCPEAEEELAALEKEGWTVFNLYSPGKVLIAILTKPA